MGPINCPIRPLGRQAAGVSGLPWAAGLSLFPAQGLPPKDLKDLFVRPECVPAKASLLRTLSGGQSFNLPGVNPWYQAHLPCAEQGAGSKKLPGMPIVGEVKDPDPSAGPVSLPGVAGGPEVVFAPRVANGGIDGASGTSAGRIFEAAKEAVASLVHEISPVRDSALWTLLQLMQQMGDPGYRLEIALAVEQKLGVGREYFGEGVVDALRQVYRHLKADPTSRGRSVAILNDPKKDVVALREALILSAYSYAETLPYGAIRLLILKGMRWLEEGDSRVRSLEEDPVEEEGLVGLGDRLKTLAEGWVQKEELLRKLPPIEVRLSGVTELDGGRFGYPTTGELVLGKGKSIIALWPLKDPQQLAETVLELLERARRVPPQAYKLSLTLSGEVGDDLQPAALAVLSSMPAFYPFPFKSKSPPGDWFAPVMEGGKTGPMGFVEMSPVHPGEERQDESIRRYEYPFLRFVSPPGAEFFGTIKGQQSLWSGQLKNFVEETQPQVEFVDEEDRHISFKMKAGESEQEAIWHPSGSDWEAMVLPLRAVQERVRGLDRKEFERRLYVALRRKALSHQMAQVIEAAWVLGMLREAKRNREDAIPFARQLSASSFRELRGLAGAFEGRFAALLEQKDLRRILETRWVGNENWEAIRKDTEAYRKALGEYPLWRQEVQKFVAAVVARGKEILGIP